jgi:hypothetical protein
LNIDRVYKQAIKRVFAEKHQGSPLAVYWGRDDGTIHVMASLTHYVHKVINENEKTLGFINRDGACVRG